MIFANVRNRINLFNCLAEVNVYLYIHELIGSTASTVYDQVRCHLRKSINAVCDARTSMSGGSTLSTPLLMGAIALISGYAGARFTLVRLIRQLAAQNSMGLLPAVPSKADERLRNKRRRGPCSRSVWHGYHCRDLGCYCTYRPSLNNSDSSTE